MSDKPEVPMSDERIEEIKQLHQNATKGYWAVVAGDEPDADYFVCSQWPDDSTSDPSDRVIGRWRTENEGQSHKDVLFIVYAHNEIVPKLIAEVERQWREIEDLKETIEIMSDPELMARIEQAQADVEAGRVVPFEQAIAEIERGRAAKSNKPHVGTE